MRAGIICGVVCSLAVGAAACGRGADERAMQQDAALEERGRATGSEITITGCLTAAPERDAFVVTAARDALTSGALYSGAGGTPTYTYELVGNATDLSQHTGRQVEVRGTIDGDHEDQVRVREEDRTEQPEVQSGDRTVTPAIETSERLNINVRRLHVSTVTPTGQACIAQDTGNQQQQQ